jgi:hypothetical protein
MESLLILGAMKFDRAIHIVEAILRKDLRRSMLGRVQRAWLALYVRLLVAMALLKGLVGESDSS